MNDETVEKLEQELHEQPLDADAIETQAKDKDAALKLMKRLPSLYNQTNKGERNFVIYFIVDKMIVKR